MANSYAETIDYLFSQLPYYQRIGPAALKPNLNNIIRLCDALGNPQNTFSTVHVAGTNGKGSTCHMLAAILQSAGYKTGLHTSPHLKDFRERIRINGQMCPEEFVVAFVSEYRPLFEQIKPSFFEMSVAMTFQYFANEGVEIAVIETGLGGRLDSTNILQPDVCVITNIGLDHVQFLGNSLREIAGEKAGIIKQNTPVVVGHKIPETAEVFALKSAQMDAPLIWVDHSSKLEYLLDLQGKHQEQNAKSAIATVEQLRSKGWKIADAHLQAGLANVVQLTGLQGRWQIIGNKPLIVCDVGHNEDGIKEVVKMIAQTPHDNLHFVFGAVNDKDVDSVMALLPTQAAYYFCRAPLPRSLDPDILLRKGSDFGLNGSSWPDPRSALSAAKASASPEDLIVVGGSTFVVAEVL